MSTLHEIEKQLESLGPAEKAQLLQWVVGDLGDASPGIESRPGVCGGEPCIVRTRTRSGCSSNRDAWGSARRICSGAIPRSVPRTWRTPGLMSAGTAMRSTDRSARTRRPERWPGSSRMRTSPFPSSKNSGDPGSRRRDDPGSGDGGDGRQRCRCPDARRLGRACRPHPQPEAFHPAPSPAAGTSRHRGLYHRSRLHRQARRIHLVLAAEPEISHQSSGSTVRDRMHRKARMRPQHRERIGSAADPPHGRPGSPVGSARADRAGEAGTGPRSVGPKRSVGGPA